MNDQQSTPETDARVGAPESFDALADALVRLSERVGELEDGLAESFEGITKSLDKLHRRVEELADNSAKKKHVKKILDILEQLEFEEDDEVAEKSGSQSK